MDPPLSDMIRQDIEEHPGYYWVMVPALGAWTLKWEPVHQVYSPPVLDQSLRWCHIHVPQGVKSFGALLSKEDDFHFKKLARDTGATYIYFREDLGMIEVWARGRSLEKAISAFGYLFRSLPRGTVSLKK